MYPIGLPQGKRVRVDDLLPDLLLFPPGTDLHDHPMVADGRLVLQVWDACGHARARPAWEWVGEDTLQ
jgi:25S rRNA (cytosine2278-C5)-methyltransferase